MNLSMLTYTVARQRKPGEPFDVKGLCRLLQEVEISAIDWCSTYEHEPREVRRITDDYGMKNIAYTARLDFCFPTPQERAPARDEFKRDIDNALSLGAGIMMIPPKGKKGLDRDTSFGYWVEGLNEVMDVAAQAGIIVTVEHFQNPTSPIISSEEMDRACEQVQGLRACFDNGNVTTAGENAGDAFRKNARLIAHCHFKDFAPCDEAEARFVGLDGVHRRAVLLGDGEVDQLGSLRAMKDCGYTGHINFEYQGDELSVRDATIEGVRRLREWMSELGIEGG